MATAGACRGGDATNACAAISSPTKIRIGATAASGKRPTSSETTPIAAPTPMTSAGGERVRRPRTHALVRGMTDVRRVLDDAAARARDDGGQRLGQEHVARGILVAGHARGLRVVDPADDGREGERQREREVRQHLVERGEPRQRGPRHREREGQRRGRMGRVTAGEPSPPEHRAADEHRGERPGHAPRQAHAGHQRREHEHERRRARPRDRRRP